MLIFYLRILIYWFLLTFVTYTQASDLDKNFNHNYCSGYLGEVYWTLDPIEEVSIRKVIEDFFNKNFNKAKDLNFDFFYNTKTQQYELENNINQKTNLKKINFPNFEIILLNTYINDFLLAKVENDYCPSFGENCGKDSIDIYFDAAKDFSLSWNSHYSPKDFLNNDFINNQCYSYLHSNINKEDFLISLNKLINILVSK